MEEPPTRRSRSRPLSINSSRVLWACVLLGVGIALHATKAGRSWSTECYSSNTCDGLTFAVVGELLNSGRSPYSTDARIEHTIRSRLRQTPPFDLPFQYPPNSLPLFGLRSLVRPELAAYLWSGLTTLGFTIALTALFLRRRTTSRDHPVSALLLLALCANGLVAFNGLLTQTGAFVGALVAVFYLYESSRPSVAGLSLGVLAIKPHYAFPILLVALARGQGRVVVGALVGFAATSLASLLFYGGGHWLAFLSTLATPNPTTPFMINWMGVLWRLHPETQVSTLTAIGLWLASLSGLTLLLNAGRRTPSAEGQVTAVLSCSLLLGPNAHPYDMLVLAPGLLQAATPRHSVLIASIVLCGTWLGLPPGMRWMLSVGALFSGVYALRFAGSTLRSDEARSAV